MSSRTATAAAFCLPYFDLALWLACRLGDGSTAGRGDRDKVSLDEGRGEVFPLSVAGLLGLTHGLVIGVGCAFFTRSAAGLSVVAAWATLSGRQRVGRRRSREGRPCDEPEL